ncbi:MAG: TrmO family methyltransferase, partial [Ruminococcus sp.]
PPRLGGNKRMGVFATRSPFRPNPIGLSLAELAEIRLHTENGPVICVKGADLMDGTPIYDIKPYLPHIESIPDAKGGFSEKAALHQLEVCISDELLEKIPAAQRNTLIEILKQDPRPSYQNDPSRIYGFYFADMEVIFRTDGNILTVTDIKL